MMCWRGGWPSYSHQAIICYEELRQAPLLHMSGPWMSRLMLSQY